MQIVVDSILLVAVPGNIGPLINYRCVVDKEPRNNRGASQRLLRQTFYDYRGVKHGDPYRSLASRLIALARQQALLLLV
jgi:hypothetical protein